MRMLVNLLVVVAAAAFVVGIVLKLSGRPVLFGEVQPIVLWRFTVGCLAFAMSMTLIQIRNLAK